MGSDAFNEVEKKIANKLECSVEELEKQYDKKIITSNQNKDGEHLFIFRKLTSKEILNGKYSSNTARYMIFTQGGQYVGYIDVAVSNSKAANEAEIQYASNKDFRNKGNVTISLEEVLKDIFLDRSFDGLQIKPVFPKTDMKKVFLAISDDNYASQSVAKKSGFIKNGECYEITEDAFLERIASTRNLLENKKKEYSQILASFDPISIEKAFRILEERRSKVQQNGSDIEEDTEVLEEDILPIFELMSKYEQDIKKIFISKGETITHITDISPNNMIGGKILKSINRANNYETERGDWVFASSNPMDGKNPYIARNPKNRMVLITQNTYIYGGDNMQIQQDEHGVNRVLLKHPNYVYRINPDKFRPVVTLRKNEEGQPYFEFSEEWISDEEVDINDHSQVLGIEEITDVTEVVRNYQILCDVNKTGEAMRIRASSNKKEAIYRLMESIRNRNLRYINRRG